MYLYNTSDSVQQTAILLPLGTIEVYLILSYTFYMKVHSDVQKKSVMKTDARPFFSKNKCQSFYSVSSPHDVFCIFLFWWKCQGSLLLNFTAADYIFITVDWVRRDFLGFAHIPDVLRCVLRWAQSTVWVGSAVITWHGEKWDRATELLNSGLQAETLMYTHTHTHTH